MDYIEKLKSPKWQQKRLEILNRDKFKCGMCGGFYGEDNQLQVHHIAYSNTDPWDIDDRLLITLCNVCHKGEQEKIKHRKTELINKLKSIGFMSGDFARLFYVFEKIQLGDLHPRLFDILKMVVNDKGVYNSLWDEIIKRDDEHFKSGGF